MDLLDQIEKCLDDELEITISKRDYGICFNLVHNGFVRTEYSAYLTDRDIRLSAEQSVITHLEYARLQIARILNSPNKPQDIEGVPV